MVASPLEVVRTFVERINAHDVDALCALMSDDHEFVDALGARVSGGSRLRKAWTDYLEAVSDYEMVVDEWIEQDDVVGLFGTASGTFAGDPQGGWTMLAAWKARVRDGRVVLWHVYGDTEQLREVLSLES